MIPRTLVPKALLPSPALWPEVPRRASTLLDARILVPQELPVVPLDGKSAIPAHVPLEVLGKRFLVPRDAPIVSLGRPRAEMSPPAASRLDARVTIPTDARPGELKVLTSAAREKLAHMVDPDVLTTGDVHLVARPVELGGARWGWEAPVSSVLFHGALLALLILQPKLFPQRAPTEREVELAHRSLGLVYIPPPAPLPRALVPQAPPAPQIKIDPRVFQRIAPPNVEASPNPGLGAPDATRKPGELTLPTPQAGAEVGRGGSEKTEPPREATRFEPPKAPGSSSGLLLKPTSPGRLLQDSLRGAARRGGSTGMEFGDTLRGGPGGGTAGRGEGYAGGAVEILTPTEGVDFTNYIARMLASVRRNWYAVIPESARLGDRGMVVLDFSVLRDGGVPYGHPELMRSSGREPLDRAAISAIRASSPFEPLPPAFTGPLVKFRFIFLYNMQRDEQP